MQIFLVGSVVGTHTCILVGDAAKGSLEQDRRNIWNFTRVRQKRRRSENKPPLCYVLVCCAHSVFNHVAP